MMSKVIGMKVKLKNIKFILITYLLLAIVSSTLTAQIITGKIINGLTKQPLEFTNIGLVGKGIGAITNELGEFTLDVSKTNSDDIIKISYIGYISLSYSIENYVQKYTTSNAIIYVFETQNNLNEVVVRPIKFKTDWVGNTHKTIANAAVQTNDKDSAKVGQEVGTRIKIKERETYIDEVTINFSENESTGCVFRLNIYDGKNANTPTILKEPIYIILESGKQIVNIDLKKYNIKVNNDFIIAMEVVKRKPKMRFNIYAVVGGSDVCTRSTINDKWEFVSFIGLSMSAKISYEDKGFFGNLFN